MGGYFQELSEDIHSLGSIDQRLERYVEARDGDETDRCLFRMLYLAQDGVGEFLARWKEMEKFALHGEPLLMASIVAANEALQKGKESIHSHPELLAVPLTQGVLYLSGQMMKSGRLDTGTILQGQFIQESLEILAGTEIKAYSRREGLRDKALQQAVGAGQIWQVAVDGMIAVSEFYQMPEYGRLDKQRGAAILAHAVLKSEFLVKTGQNGLGQRLQQSLGTSGAAENFQQDMERNNANQWLCSQSREQILDLVSTAKGNQKIMQAVHGHLRAQTSADKKSGRVLAQAHGKEDKAAVREIGKR